MRETIEWLSLQGDQHLLIMAACYLAFCLGSLMLMTGISYLVEAFRRTSYYRYDSADFIPSDDEDEDDANKPPPLPQ
jgi:hypothetical protein